MAKTRLLKSTGGAISVASGPKIKGRIFLLVLLVVAALSLRLFWQQRKSGSLPPPELAMNDSTAELPVAPPPLPGDNAASLRAAYGPLETLSATTSPQVQEQAAVKALELGDLWRAEGLARTVLQQIPNNHLARLTLGGSLRRQARFAEATRLYHRLLQEDRRDSDAYLGLADTAFDANRRPEAFDWLAKGESEGAQTPLSLTTLAHRYQDWKDYPKAEATAAHALQIAPNDINVRLQLASIQVESGELDAGYQTLATILQQDPNNGLAHRLMGVVLSNAAYRHQDLNRARTLLEKAVELNARDKDIYRAAAVIYRQQHLYRLAAQAYNALLSLDPTSLDGRYGLGQVYAMLGKNDLSQQQLALYKQLEERQRRVTRLTEEVTHHPASAESHAALARTLEATGDSARALTQYQIAGGLAPRDAATLAALNQLYARLGWGRPEHKQQ